ncbi:MAG: hypothetical protein Q9180_004342 [Flavoplaca navasiana]
MKYLVQGVPQQRICVIQNLHVHFHAALLRPKWPSPTMELGGTWELFWRLTFSELVKLRSIHIFINTHPSIVGDFETRQIYQVWSRRRELYDWDIRLQDTDDRHLAIEARKRARYPPHQISLLPSFPTFFVITMNALNEVDSSDNKHPIRPAHQTTTTIHSAAISYMESSKPSSDTAAEGIASMYESEMFSIYAGPARKHFTAHASILRQSPMLAKIVDGNWKDSEERNVDFPQYEEETMRQLLDFLYYGHYHMSLRGLPKPSPDNNVEAELTGDKTTGREDSGNVITAVQVSTDPDPARPAHEITQVGFPADHKASVAETIGIKEKYVATIRAFTLLQHSQLYVFAHYIQLTSLEVEAYEHIGAILDLVQELPHNHLGYIIQLIRHVYEHTDTLINSKEPLRELVATFVSKWFHDFQGDEMKKLMGKGGDFVIDVMAKVQQRALAEKKEHNAVEEDLRNQVAKYQKRLRKRGGKVDKDA